MKRIETKLQNLEAGQRFHFPRQEGTITGEVIYHTPCRSYVLLHGEPTTREFTTAMGNTVSFTSPGNKHTSWSLETIVEVVVACA